MLDKKEIKKGIEKLIKNEDISDKQWEGDENIDQLSMELEQAGVILFSWQGRNDNSSDYWTQIEYYSKALSKTIIWDYGAKDSFESLDGLVDYIYRVNKETEAFESRITLRPKSHKTDK
jgi:hypothetical protein